MPGFSRFVSSLACIGVLIVSGTVPAAADSAPRKLGAAQNWTAYERTTPDGKVCYAMSQAASSDPAKLKRNTPYLLINFWPGRKSTEIQIVPGYGYKSGAKVQMQIGRTTFDFFGKNEGGQGAAWVKDEAKEDDVLKALRNGSRATVSGVSSRGTKVQDTYSLRGISAMVDKARQSCRK